MLVFVKAIYVYDTPDIDVVILRGFDFLSALLLLPSFALTVLLFCLSVCPCVMDILSCVSVLTHACHVLFTLLPCERAAPA